MPTQLLIFILVPDPEVACEGDHITVSFLRSTEPRLEEDHLTLTAEGNTDCGYVTDTTTDYVIIKIQFVGCDTLKEVWRYLNIF